jgi:hypothetical protein
MDFARIIRIAELYPEQVKVYPLAANLQGLARQNAKRDAYARVSIDDADVKALQGPEDTRPLMFMVRIPRALVDRADAPLVLPNLGAPKSGGIILPAGAR